MNVLVTGGAGYIGSHAVKALREAGHAVVVLDNLSRGHRAAVPADVPFEQIDLRDTARVADALTRHGTQCVMHFAALAYVGESVTEPLKYYDNNTAGSISLLHAMSRAGVRRLVFSSTCATYGEPARMPITEDLPQSPINPYGWSKLFTERCLIDFAAANPDFAFTALRYFNVAGSAADGAIGEDHRPESHVIPLLLLTALGKRDSFTIFGEDYDTPDGTCIRDYIHVEDLAAAHLRALDYLRAGGAPATLNCGYGRGFSVREVLAEVGRVAGRPLQVTETGRRAGDPPQLVAAAQRIRDTLGWAPRHQDLPGIVATALAWEQRLLRQPMA